jgi:replicative DNA helicase
MEPELAQLRVPPNATEAEQSLIGALLIDNLAWERIADVITPKDFYRGVHRVIYERIELLIASNEPADIVTVSESLKEIGKLEEIGGPTYLAGLTQNTPSSANVRRYAELIRVKALQRSLIRVCGEVIDAAWAPNADPDRLFEEAERRIFELRQRRLSKDAPTFKTLLKRVYESIDQRHQKRGEITGLATGFAKVDTLTAGLQPGDLVIVAGRPSMGKTSFAMNVAEHVGLEKKRPVAVFSIEMQDVQLVQRMVGSVGRVDQHRLRTGMLTDEDWSRTTDAVGRLHDCPFFIEETVALTITELRARARRIARDNPGLAMIVIDYLQLMASKANTQSERTHEIGEISRGLKALAIELAIPVVALSQLNRAVEQRINKRPMMSDLKDSGSIEQDADLIVFLYRDEVYSQDSQAEGYAEAIIGKQRNGAVGTVYLRFVKEETRFEDTDWKPERRQRKKKSGFVAQAEEEARQAAEAEE